MLATLERIQKEHEERHKNMQEQMKTTLPKRIQSFVDDNRTRIEELEKALRSTIKDRDNVFKSLTTQLREKEQLLQQTRPRPGVPPRWPAPPAQLPPVAQRRPPPAPYGRPVARWVGGDPVMELELLEPPHHGAAPVPPRPNLRAGGYYSEVVAQNGRSSFQYGMAKPQFVYHQPKPTNAGEMSPASSMQTPHSSARPYGLASRAPSSGKV